MQPRITPVDAFKNTFAQAKYTYQQGDFQRALILFQDLHRQLNSNIYTYSISMLECFITLCYLNGGYIEHAQGMINLKNIKQRCEGAYTTNNPKLKAQMKETAQKIARILASEDTEVGRAKSLYAQATLIATQLNSDQHNPNNYLQIDKAIAHLSSAKKILKKENPEHSIAKKTCELLCKFHERKAQIWMTYWSNQKNEMYIIQAIIHYKKSVSNTEISKNPALSLLFNLMQAMHEYAQFNHKANKNHHNDLSNLIKKYEINKKITDEQAQETRRYYTEKLTEYLSLNLRKRDREDQNNQDADETSTPKRTKTNDPEAQTSTNTVSQKGLRLPSLLVRKTTPTYNRFFSAATAASAPQLLDFNDLQALDKKLIEAFNYFKLNNYETALTICRAICAKLENFLAENYFDMTSLNTCKKILLQYQFSTVLFQLYNGHLDYRDAIDILARIKNEYEILTNDISFTQSTIPFNQLLADAQTPIAQAINCYQASDLMLRDTSQELTIQKIESSINKLLTVKNLIAHTTHPILQKINNLLLNLHEKCGDYWTDKFDASESNADYIARAITNYKQCITQYEDLHQPIPLPILFSLIYAEDKYATLYPDLHRNRLHDLSGFILKYNLDTLIKQHVESEHYKELLLNHIDAAAQNMMRQQTPELTAQANPSAAIPTPSAATAVDTDALVGDSIFDHQVFSPRNW